MAEGSISTSDLPSYGLDGLFDSFGKETLLEDDYIRSYDNVGELNHTTDHDSWIIVDRYMDTSDDKSYSVKPEQEHHTVLSM